MPLRGLEVSPEHSHGPHLPESQADKKGRIVPFTAQCYQFGAELRASPSSERSRWDMNGPGGHAGGSPRLPARTASDRARGRARAASGSANPRSTSRTVPRRAAMRISWSVALGLAGSWPASCSARPNCSSAAS